MYLPISTIIEVNSHWTPTEFIFRIRTHLDILHSDHMGCNHHHKQRIHLIRCIHYTHIHYNYNLDYYHSQWLEIELELWTIVRVVKLFKFESLKIYDPVVLPDDAVPSSCWRSSMTLHSFLSIRYNGFALTIIEEWRTFTRLRFMSSWVRLLYRPHEYIDRNGLRWLFSIEIITNSFCCWWMVDPLEAIISKLCFDCESAVKITTGILLLLLSFVIIDAILRWLVRIQLRKRTQNDDNGHSCVVST